MYIKTVFSHDGIPLRYRYINSNEDWIVFIIPFGLDIDLADAFFNFFKKSYNIVTWEARTILADSDHVVNSGELTVENHTKDVFTIMDELKIGKAAIVGYCSGAGIALNAVSKHPELFTKLSLVNGEYALLTETGCVSQYANDIDDVLPVAADSEAMAQFIIDRIQFKDENGVPDGINLPFSTAHYLHRYATNYLSYRSTDFLKLAESIKIKTQLISGELDLQANVNSTLKVSEHLRSPAIYVDPKGDHYDILRPDSTTLIKISEFVQVIDNG